MVVSLRPVNNFVNNLGSHSQGNQSYSCVIAQEQEQNVPQYATPYASIHEPVSGFSTALQNVYSHVLDTFISVLSSISSHILHSIFYNVIEEVISGRGVSDLTKKRTLHLSNQMSDSKKNSKIHASSHSLASKSQVRE